MAKKKKTKLERLKKKYNDLIVEHELTKGNFEDFAESSVEQSHILLNKIERLRCRIIFKDHTIGILKSRIGQLERGRP